jgi:hypothetical protein
MDSELELNDTIHEMNLVATRPDLYYLLIEKNSIQILLGLLSHENTGNHLDADQIRQSILKSQTPIEDVSASVIYLIQELTDVDSSAESAQSSSLLIDALVSPISC